MKLLGLRSIIARVREVNRSNKEVWIVLPRLIPRPCERYRTNEKLKEHIFLDYSWKVLR